MAMIGLRGPWDDRDSDFGMREMFSSGNEPDCAPLEYAKRLAKMMVESGTEIEADAIYKLVFHVNHSEWPEVEIAIFSGSKLLFEKAR